MWITEISTYVFDSLLETLFENCGKPKGFQSGVRIGPQNPVQNRKNGAFFKRLKRTTPRRIQSECSNTKSLHYLKVCQQNEIFSPHPPASSVQSSPVLAVLSVHDRSKLQQRLKTRNQSGESPENRQVVRSREILKRDPTIPLKASPAGHPNPVRFRIP